MTNKTNCWWISWVVTHFVGWLVAKDMFKNNLRNELGLLQTISAIELHTWFCVVFLVVSVVWFFVANALTSRLLMRQKIVGSYEFQGPSATQVSQGQGAGAVGADDLLTEGNSTSALTGQGE
jgi:hypothetical protein